VVRTVADFAPLWNELFPAEQARIVRLLVECVDLAPGPHRGAAAGGGAADAGRGVPVAGGGSGVETKRKVAGKNWEFDCSTITVRLPMTFKRRGGRKVVIAPDGGDAWVPARPRPDETLIRVLARAHRWRRLLEEGGSGRRARLGKPKG
jgi:hypothetical protein